MCLSVDEANVDENDVDYGAASLPFFVLLNFLFQGLRTFFATERTGKDPYL